jgi:simple sugar transport system permease protein
VAPGRLVLARLLSVAVALLLGGLLLAALGTNPLTTYGTMLSGAFGTPAEWLSGQFYSLSETVVKAIPITLASLAVLVAFRALFWNIGVDGQFAMGTMAATGVALFLPNYLPSLPGWLLLTLMLVAGMAAGALWASIAAGLKLAFGVNEIISTIMLNFIAILFVEYLFFGPWQDPQGMGFPGTAPFPDAARLPRLYGRVHLGIAFVLAAAALIWVWLDFTPWGYEIKVMGQNREAARYAGMPLLRNTLLVMAISGGLAGLAGMTEVAGLSYRLQQGVLVGYGNIAIIVAWLTNLRVWPAVLVSFLMAALAVGGEQLQISMGLPASVALVLEGLILFTVLAAEFFVRYQVQLINETTPAPTEQ